MRLIPINCVKEGVYLAQELNDSDGRVLLKKGVQLNEGLIKKIEESGVYTIYIVDEYSSNEIEDVLKPQLRNAAVKTIKDTFEHFGQYNNQLKDNNSLKSKQILQRREQYLKTLNNISKEIVEEILYNKNVMINLVDIKSLDSYTYQHSVNVTVLSLILGIELRLNKHELYDLCMGAMLHDLGRVFIPKSILMKKGQLTSEEYEIIKTHTQKGYEYLAQYYQLPTVAKLIALQHHERIDGSGYPNGITGESITKLSKIVAIADVYDAMTSDTSYRKAISPQEVIELIMGGAGRLFDFEMVQLFVRKVIPYPVGSLVKLSNGDVGVVEEVRPNFPLRPKIKVIRQTAVSVDMKEIDLMNETNLVIVGLQHEIPNVSVPHYLQKRIDE